METQFSRTERILGREFIKRLSSSRVIGAESKATDAIDLSLFT